MGTLSSVHCCTVPRLSDLLPFVSLTSRWCTSAVKFRSISPPKSFAVCIVAAENLGSISLGCSPIKDIVIQGLTVTGKSILILYSFVYEIICIGSGSCKYQAFYSASWFQRVLPSIWLAIPAASIGFCWWTVEGPQIWRLPLSFVQLHLLQGYAKVLQWQISHCLDGILGTG